MGLGLLWLVAFAAIFTYFDALRQVRKEQNDYIRYESACIKVRRLDLFDCLFFCTPAQNVIRLLPLDVNLEGNRYFFGYEAKGSPAW